MKTLFICQGLVHDYLSDQIFHGLRTVLGPDVVDIPHLEYMYRGTEHGGFSVWGLLPPVEVDRYDIVSQIKEERYDLIVYGDVQVCRDYLPIVLEHYPPNRIVFIDGRDDDNSLADVIGQGLYFKREKSPGAEVFPIQFCIPKEKVRPIELGRKTRLMSHVDPRDRSTYVYGHDETAYYDQYSEAYFGYTMKKGGWDCMRHYEIIACACLPYFGDLESCPPEALFRLPKQELIAARSICDNWLYADDSVSKWQDMMEKIQGFLLRDLTTESMAKYVLDKVKNA